LLAKVRAACGGAIIWCGGFTNRESAQRALAKGSADLNAFGGPYIANPNMRQANFREQRRDATFAQALSGWFVYLRPAYRRLPGALGGKSGSMYDHNASLTSSFDIASCQANKTPS